MSDSRRKMMVPQKSIKGNHEYVDLGLSVYWATMNVGSSTEEGYGKYYAFGAGGVEDPSSLTYYQGQMPESADNAVQTWGNGWRTPTKSELEELINLPYTYTSKNGINVCEFSAPNGKSIFLPLAGVKRGRNFQNVGTYGFYWSSTAQNNVGHTIQIGNGGVQMSSLTQNYKITVRPVIDK